MNTDSTIVNTYSNPTGKSVHDPVGMPVHDHGLPTLPLATQNLGDGDYLVEGMKFHMNGWWQVTLSIVSGDDSDSVTFDLQL